MDPLRNPSFRLDGRRALITGASSGIGLAAAAALYQAGSDVMLVARSAPDLIAACARIQGATGQNDTRKQPKIDFHALDVTDSKAVADWIASDAQAYGTFDVLVNNAGTNRPSTIVDL